jgi:hypothetical protein
VQPKRLQEIVRQDGRRHALLPEYGTIREATILTRVEFARGHLPGVVHVPKEDADAHDIGSRPPTPRTEFGSREGRVGFFGFGGCEG